MVSLSGPQNRSYLKNVFWPNLFGGASFQLPIRLRRTSGLKRGPAATLNQNPIFEIASIKIITLPHLPCEQGEAGGLAGDMFLASLDPGNNFGDMLEVVQKELLLQLCLN